MDTPNERAPIPGLPDPPTAEPAVANVHELRPLNDLKICPECLVSNSDENRFCTACGKELPEGAPDNTATEVLPPVETAAALAGEFDQTAVGERWPAGERKELPPTPAPSAKPAAVAGHDRRVIALAVIVVLLLTGFVAATVLWRSQASHAQHLSRTLSTTRATLASTQADLVRTRKTLVATSSESEKRRQALVQTQDVLAKVDPLLSSVDSVQNKAGALGTQGSTISSDAEAFIGTVADLVNYMLQPGENDYVYVGQQIDVANSELDTIRADESLFSDDNSAYGDASTAFGTKATAFTQSVRQLQKQLKGAVGK